MLQDNRLAITLPDIDGDIDARIYDAIDLPKPTLDTIAGLLGSFLHYSVWRHCQHACVPGRLFNECTQRCTMSAMVFVSRQHM